MHRVVGIACLLVATAAAQAPRAISDGAYIDAMKEIGPLSQQLRANLDDRAGAAASMAAARLEELFGDVLAYWEARRVEDASKGARTAVAAAGRVSTALAAGDLDAAARAQRVLQGTCRGCHLTYRERLPDGTYRFK